MSIVLHPKLHRRKTWREVIGRIGAAQKGRPSNIPKTRVTLRQQTSARFAGRTFRSYFTSPHTPTVARPLRISLYHRDQHISKARARTLGRTTIGSQSCANKNCGRLSHEPPPPHRLDCEYYSATPRHPQQSHCSSVRQTLSAKRSTPQP